MSNQSKNDGEEMKKLIQNWLISKKYSQIKAELDRKKSELKNIMALDRDALVKYMETNGMFRTELVDAIKRIQEYDALSEQDKNELEWVSNTLISVTSKEEVYLDYLRTIMTWYTYIYIYQTIEDYELCAEIKKCVEIEKREFIYVLKTYYEFLPEDENFISQIECDVIKKLLLDK